MHVHKRLVSHRRFRNGVLFLSWLLVLLSWYCREPIAFAAGGLLINGYAFGLMVKDKWSARRSRFRIPEYSLFCLAVLGGAIGVGAAMLVVRHKTRHLSFWAVVFCSILIHLSLLFWLFGRD